MKQEDLIKLNKEMLQNELFFVGSYVGYPKIGSTDEYYYGYIEKIDCMNNTVSIKDDLNMENPLFDENGYEKSALCPVLITEGFLLQIGFKKIEGQLLYGLPQATYFEYSFDENGILQLIEAGTGRFCMVIPSKDAFFGCSFTPIIYIHRLQKIMEFMKQ